MKKQEKGFLAAGLILSTASIIYGAYDLYKQRRANKCINVVRDMTREILDLNKKDGETKDEFLKRLNDKVREFKKFVMENRSFLKVYDLSLGAYTYAVNFKVWIESK